MDLKGTSRPSISPSPFVGTDAPSVRRPSFVELLDELHQDPYPAYRWFRTHDPIHRHVPQATGAPAHWYLFRHQDALAALTSPRLVKRMDTSGPGGIGATAAPDGAYSDMVSRWILLLDPPQHERLRAPLSRAFTPRVVEGLRPRVEEITRELLEHARPRGGMDLIADFAFPLPVAVIVELLGLSRTDQALFRDWSLALAAAIDHKRSASAIQRADRAVADSRSYFGGVIAERRHRPGDGLLDALVAADELSESDIVSTCMMLVFAGHETTTNLIGNGALALLHDPEQAAHLRQDARLVEPAVEELLRYERPVQLTTRIVLEDHEFAGRQLRRGERVHVLLGAANRDPEAFVDPDRLDLGRAPNRHLALGAGIHFCLGASLGRLEGQVALAALVRAFPELMLREGAQEWRRSVIFRGLVTLPVDY
jgi:cytochrome P450